MLRVKFGGFELDEASRLLLKDGVDLHLTPKAFDLLLLLVANAPRVISKEELHCRLWTDTFVSDAALAGLIKQLRRVLRDHDRKAPLVRTVHGVGVAFTGEAQQTAPPLATISRWIVANSTRIMLALGENVIGRDPAAAVQLGASGVSRRHACIVVDGAAATLHDMGSKNGTLVNDSLVTNFVVLRDGDRIQAGPAVVVYHESATGVSTDTVVPNS